MISNKEQKEDKPELLLFPHISTGEETSFLIEKDKEDNPFFYEGNSVFAKDPNKLNKEDENFINNLNKSFHEENRGVLKPKTELSDYFTQQFGENQLRKEDHQKKKKEKT